METAMASAAAKAARTPSVSVQQMPLSFLKEGESAHVVKVRGRGDLQHHLENLGFVEGAEVKVVSGVAGGIELEIRGRMERYAGEFAGLLARGRRSRGAPTGTVPNAL